MVVVKIRVRLKYLNFLLVAFIYWANSAYAEIESLEKRHELTDQFNFTLNTQLSQIENTHLLAITRSVKKHRRTNHHHHRRHSHFKARDLYKKRTAVLIKSDLQSDYVSAIVGKDVQLDCKMVNLAHDDDKVDFLFEFFYKKNKIISQHC